MRNEVVFLVFPITTCRGNFPGIKEDKKALSLSLFLFWSGAKVWSIFDEAPSLRWGGMFGWGIWEMEVGVGSEGMNYSWEEGGSKVPLLRPELLFFGGGEDESAFPFIISEKNFHA